MLGIGAFTFALQPAKVGFTARQLPEDAQLLCFLGVRREAQRIDAVAQPRSLGDRVLAGSLVAASPNGYPRQEYDPPGEPPVTWAVGL